MPCFPARWTKTLAAAALLTLPMAASGQTTVPAQTPDTKVNAAASKQHLGAARDTLNQLTSMPEAARLQGDARTQVSQIITSFNELITTQSDWRSAYGKLDASLTALLGPDGPDQPPAPSGVAGAVGTAGAVSTAGAATATLDPAVRAKLVEFRSHLKEFERAAGGNAPGAMAPSVAADVTANPAAVSVPAQAPADQTKDAGQAGHSEADKHLDAISAILNQSRTGTLTKVQTAALKKHVAQLRALLNPSR